MYKKTVIFCITAIIFVSCSSFIKEDQVPVLKEFESAAYVLTKDVETGGVAFKKDQEVRLIVITGDDWIKVYGYRAGEDKLKAQRVLVLYLFSDDFPDEKFSMEKFREQLYLVAAPVK